MKSATKNSKGKMENSTLTKNREATFQFEVIEKYEAGIVLNGPEVKSVKEGQVNLKGSYITIDHDEAILKKAHISPYKQASENNSEPLRDRKLLMHKKEILQLDHQIQANGLTLIPLSLFLKKGKIKVSLALCRGKKIHDKRENLKKKAQHREIERNIKRY